MTARIAPVIPPSAVRPRRQSQVRERAAPLPLARPVRSVPPEDVVYGLARIDASGRICERAIITVLGWAGGDRLTLTADAGVVTMRLIPTAWSPCPPAATSPSRPRCAAAAAWSQATRCCWPPLPGEDSLAAFSLAVVDQAIRAHGALPHAQGGNP